MIINQLQRHLHLYASWVNCISQRLFYVAVLSFYFNKVIPINFYFIFYKFNNFPMGTDRVRETILNDNLYKNSPTCSFNLKIADGQPRKLQYVSIKMKAIKL